MLRPLFRWYHWLYAEINGYFWTKCVNCGHGFGGHEKNNGSLYMGQGRGWTTCNRPQCLKETERRNEKFFEDNPYDCLMICDEKGHRYATEEEIQAYKEKDRARQGQIQ